MAAKANNLQGGAFGNLVAIRPTDKRNHNKTIIWECQCTACGQPTEVVSTKLVSGEAKSCGCQEHCRPARTAPGISGFNALYSSYKYHAKARNLDFELKKKDFKKLVTADCSYCRASPAMVTYGSSGARKEYGKFISNGVDRVDNSLGYSADNCVPACKTCNLAKGTMSGSEFRAWITRVYTTFNF